MRRNRGQDPRNHQKTRKWPEIRIEISETYIDKETNEIKIDPRFIVEVVPALKKELDKLNIKYEIYGLIPTYFHIPRQNTDDNKEIQLEK